MVIECSLPLLVDGGGEYSLLPLTLVWEQKIPERTPRLMLVLPLASSLCRMFLALKNKKR